MAIARQSATAQRRLKARDARVACKVHQSPQSQPLRSRHPANVGQRVLRCSVPSFVEIPQSVKDLIAATLQSPEWLTVGVCSGVLVILFILFLMGQGVGTFVLYFCTRWPYYLSSNSGPSCSRVTPWPKFATNTSPLCLRTHHHFSCGRVSGAVHSPSRAATRSSSQSSGRIAFFCSVL